MSCAVLFFFFFRQKTAYEMRISDWSSDVCSSDLGAGRKAAAQNRLHLRHQQLVAAALEQPALDLVGRGARPGQREQQLAAVVGLGGGEQLRSAERRVGKGCVSPCRSRWSQSH